MVALIDQSVVLPNGRRVACNEYGDLHGRPLLLLHALFFSRTFEPVDAQAAERGIRVITPDRPGVGRSDSGLRPLCAGRNTRPGGTAAPSTPTGVAEVGCRPFVCFPANGTERGLVLASDPGAGFLFT